MLNKYMVLYNALPLILDARAALQALDIAEGLETHLASSSLLPGSDSHRFVTDRIRDARRRVSSFLLTLL